MNGSQTTYAATGLVPGTAYSFKIVAADADGDESNYSNAVSATTPIDPWNVQVTGSSTVAEGEKYQLNLSMSSITGAPAWDQASNPPPICQT